MTEDNDKKVIYLAEVLEKCVKAKDLKVLLGLFRKYRESKGCLGLAKLLFKLKS